MTMSDPLHEETEAPDAKQAFPRAASLTVSAERVSLESLVHHCKSVPHDMPLEDVEKVFREKDVDFLAILRGDRVLGLCARVRMGALLGSRYGFALYSRMPATLAQVDHPLVVSTSDPIRQVLYLALARGAGEFHEDVALVDASHKLLGLVSVEALAQLQSRLVGEQLDQMKHQSEVLQRQNLDLFQAGHAQRQAQGLYQGLFESNALGVALLGSHGTVQAHNRRLLELLNLTGEETSVTSLDGWMDEADRLKFHRFLEKHEQSVQSSGPQAQEFTFNVTGRGARLFHATSGWIRETGQVCVFLDDITEQRSLELNAIRQEKQRLLDTLVGGIAHELNNKLMPVLGFAEILVDQVDEESSKMAKIIQESAGEAAGIIRQLLQLSKPDTGLPRNFDLSALVEETLLMTKFQIRESRSELRLRLPTGGVFVVADPAKMKQVVINLILNALQAMEDTKEPVLTVTVSRGPAGAVMTIADNGTGISPECLGRIFDPFFTTKGPDRGTGLGLSICYSVVRQFHGEITVESQLGAGATFTVTLPEAAKDEKPLAVPAPPPAVAEAIGRSNRVLVVDDEDVVRILLQEMLRSTFGCDVDLAPNGAEALALIGRHSYDMVISDIRMPVMAGTELYQRLRDSHPELLQRFVFITGHPGSKSMQDEIAQWDVPVLAKPFTSKKLSQVCRPLLVRPDPGAVPA
jgi:signal transduction histidine kinase